MFLLRNIIHRLHEERIDVNKQTKGAKREREKKKCVRMATWAEFIINTITWLQREEICLLDNGGSTGGRACSKRDVA